MTTTDYTPENLPGQTVHALHGTRYKGVWAVDRVSQPDEHGCVVHDGRYSMPVLYSELYASEAEARAAAKAARKPRQVRRPVPLYGDFAQLAAMHGYATDGTGRRLR